MSAPNFNRTEPYTLTLATGEVDRTTWWKDENRREPAGVWWIEGPGVSRPATDIEIDLWKQSVAYQAEQMNAAVLAEFAERTALWNKSLAGRPKRTRRGK